MDGFSPRVALEVYCALLISRSLGEVYQPLFYQADTLREDTLPLCREKWLTYSLNYIVRPTLNPNPNPMERNQPLYVE